MSGCLCVVGDTYLLTKHHAAGGPFSCLDPPPSPRCLPLQLANTLPRACAGFESLLPNIPLPRLPLFTRHTTTDHSFSLPERKRARPATLVHATCCAAAATRTVVPVCVCARAPAACWNPITPWLLDRLLFSSWKSRHAAAAVYGTLLGHTRIFACCRVVVVCRSLSSRQSAFATE